MTPRRRAALYLLPLAAGLAAAELSLRTYALVEHRWNNPSRGARVDDFARLLRPSAHPELGLELRPGLDVDFRGGRLSTNAAGFRDQPRQKRKAPGVYRIAGVGDSVMMGWGVNQGEDYLSALEGLLRARGREAEVLNFAVAGYNTVQEYFVLRDVVLDYEPDLVVIGYVGNDFEPPNFRRPRARFDSPSYALNLAVLAWRRVTGDLAPGETHDWRPFRRDPGPAPSGFVEALGAIGELCRERRIPAVLLLDSRYESPQLSHRNVALFARSLGMETVDLMAAYRRLKPGTPVAAAVGADDAHNRELILKDDGHPNALWHRRTAELLADRLTRTSAAPIIP